MEIFWNHLKLKHFGFERNLFGLGLGMVLLLRGAKKNKIIFINIILYIILNLST